MKEIIVIFKLAWEKFLKMYIRKILEDLKSSLNKKELKLQQNHLLNKYKDSLRKINLLNHNILVITNGIKEKSLIM